MNAKHYAMIGEKTEKSIQEIQQKASQKCFENWKERRHKCIILAAEGGYFEGDKIVIWEINK